MTLALLLARLRPDVAHVPSDDTMRDLRILAAHALGVERGRLTLHMQDEVEDSVQSRLVALVAQRAAGAPISKIIGKRSFWGRMFSVTEDVLDPRAETESLIEAALELGAQGRVLDLGTGSGAIAVTMAAEWPQAEIWATDISEAALDVARGNAKALGVAGRVHFVRSDWLADVSGRFNLILSNPPYIAIDEMAGLTREVREFDPLIALSDGADGLSVYRLLAAQAPDHLVPGGALMVETGWAQGAAVQALFTAAGFGNVRCLQDMGGRDRVVIGHWQG